MEIFVWLPEYGLIMDGHVHILSSGWAKPTSTTQKAQMN